uniref:Mic1 domain-containing protein n=1 Tax=Panagrellus redivivus TaxID=6233 RepID=A0A7E4VYS1_PANRE
MSDEAPGPSTAKRSRDDETPSKESEEEVIYGKVKQSYGNLMRKRKLGMPIRPCEYDGVLSPYQATVPPNFEMTKIERPPVVPLRFTYNGKMMIASTHQHQYVVYNYLGVGNAIGCSERHVFDKVFSVRFAVNLPDHQENRYARDTMFILEDDDHFITATSYALPETSRLPANVTQRNSETIVTNSSHMETYVFYTISLDTGKITDKLEITFDLLNIHHCLYLRGRTFIVLSIMHQTIHVYHIDRRTGKFLKEAEIGEYLEPPADRPFPLSNVHAVFTSWRQILMKKFYEYHKLQNTIPQFFESSPIYRSLKMTRVQLVSDTILLIRLVPEDYVSCDRSAAHQQVVPFFFAFYDFVDMEMLAVYGATSQEMLEIYEKNSEAFKYAFLTKPKPPLTLWYRDAMKFQRNSLKSAFLSKLEDQGSKKKEAELCRKVLAELPFAIPSCPSFTPFLDPGAFSFDKNIIPALERQRVSSDVSISCAVGRDVQSHHRPTPPQHQPDPPRISIRSPGPTM